MSSTEDQISGARAAADVEGGYRTSTPPMPSSAPLSNFSIDDDESSPTDPSGGIGEEVDDELERNYDSDGVDGDDDGGFKLAQRTNQIMNSYQEYLTEITSEPIEGGDAEAAKRELDGGADHSLPSHHVPFDRKGSVGSAVGAVTEAFSGLYQDFSHIRDNKEQHTNLHDAAFSDVTDVDSFQDFYGELGFHPKRNYRHPFLRSNKFKGIVCGVLLGIIVLIVGLTASNEKGDNASTSKKGDGTDDANTEWWDSDESLLEEDEEDMAGKPGGVVPQSPSSNLGRPMNLPNTKQEINAEYAEMYQKYRPEWFNRTQWKGNTYEDALIFCATQNGMIVCPFEAVCPRGVNDVPAGGVEVDTEQAFAPILTETSSETWVQIGAQNNCVETDGQLPEFEGQDVTAHIMCCAPMMDGMDGVEEGENGMDGVEEGAEGEAAIDPDLLESIMTEYSPQEYTRSQGWSGTTYVDAVNFCEEKGSLSLCPYRALCPGNFVGIFNNGYDETWVPIDDMRNDWVQIGSADICVRFSEEYPYPPSWGETGAGSEGIATSVVCCDYSKKDGGKDEYTVDYGEATQDIYSEVSRTYKPKWFDRKSGWSGHTYLEAVAFCDTTENHVLCPYAAICPLGHDQPPIYGERTSSSQTIESWTPYLSDDVNTWVQVGPNDKCVKYYNMHGANPDWGLTGDVSDHNDRDIMGNVICCELNEDGSGFGAEGINLVVNNAKIEEATAPPPENTEQEVISIDDRGPYHYVQETFNPIWFESPQWNGGSYEESSKFCADTSRDGHALELCSFEAICPQGPQKRPFGGVKSSSFDYIWAPISNDINFWVSVGPDHPCMLYNVINGEHPEFGSGGADSEKSTQVMCCDATDEQALSVVGTLPEEGDEVPVVTSGDENDITSQMSAELTADIKLEYDPVWYSRDDGYSGIGDYDGAVEFCASRAREVCDFVAVCPDGKLPYGGVKDDVKGRGQWAPIADDYDSWVSLNQAKPCTVYEEASWQDVDGSEDLLRWVLCCLAPPEYSHDDVENDQPDTALDKTPTIEDSPVWFDRETGWTGLSYPEGREFCDKSGFALCSYDTLCPDGIDRPPFGGELKDGPDGTDSYAPVEDGINEWISIGSANTCISWSNMRGSTPEWGMAGGEEAKRHVFSILCCPSKEGGEAETITESDEPESKPGTKPMFWYHDPLSSSGCVFSSDYPIYMVQSNSTEIQYLFDSEDSCCDHDIDLCPNPERTHAPVSIPVTTTTTSTTISTTASSTIYAPSNCRWHVSPDTRHVCSNSNTDDETHVSHFFDSADKCCSYRYPLPCTVEYGGCTLDEDTSEPTIAAEPITTLANEEEQPASPVSSLVSHTLDRVQDKYMAEWYSKEDGWAGKSYYDTILFCAEKGSRIPCPYEAYCPLGPGAHLLGGGRGEGESWAPIIDVPNGWVQVGSDNTCMPYNAIHVVPPAWGLDVDETDSGIGIDISHVMCCHEPEDGFGWVLEDEQKSQVNVEEARTELEQTAMDIFHPVWYSRRDGYQGTTHYEADLFCRNIGHRQLCPIEAYCPNGQPDSSTHDDLYLNRGPFEGEQWAPIRPLSGGATDWLLIGTLRGNPTSTCATYSQLEDSEPTWDIAGSQSEQKQHVLCCSYDEDVDEGESLEEIVKDVYNPIWFGDVSGWTGGSWNDAQSFCDTRGMQLCPYSAYCPNGRGQPALGGHAYDFNDEGEQWAPLSETPNSWVMIGRKYQNSATTCMSFNMLEGFADPVFSFSQEKAYMKRFLLCCRN